MRMHFHHQPVSAGGEAGAREGPHPVALSHTMRWIHEYRQVRYLPHQRDDVQIERVP